VGTLTDQLRREPPGLHAGGSEYWGLAWDALAWLEREVRPGMATLETGSGASTLVFAAGGAEHEAVTPSVDEEARFRAACEQFGIDGTRVSFRIGLSHDVLGSLDKVKRLVKTLGWVNCTTEFTDQPKVMNGFSDLMKDVFGDDAGVGSRSAVSAHTLPGGIAVEVECIFEVG